MTTSPEPNARAGRADSTTGTPVRHDRLVTGPFVAVTAAALAFFVYIGVLVVVVPRFVENELGAGEFGVGLTLAAFAGTAIAVRPLIGWAGDRYGRRRLMMVGAVIAAVAGGFAGLAGSLPVLLILRGLTGVGEAAMFVGAATLITELAPAHRRAEAASYFSVAVFGGLGIGPVLGEWILGDDRWVLTFAVAGGFGLLGALLVLAVPRSIDRRATGVGRPRARYLHPAAVGPGLVLAAGIGGFSVFSAFVPEYARDVGLAGAGALFFVYSLTTLSLRIVAARLPERLGAGRSVTLALVLISTALAVLAGVPTAAGLWAAAVIVGVGMAFMYPSLMAIVANRAGDDERASAVSSFTMFFEVGSVVGGIALGAVAQVFGKPAGFAGGAVLAATGLIVLWTRVVGPVAERRAAAGRPLGPAVTAPVAPSVVAGE